MHGVSEDVALLLYSIEWTSSGSVALVTVVVVLVTSARSPKALITKKGKGINLSDAKAPKEDNQISR